MTPIPRHGRAPRWLLGALLAVAATARAATPPPTPTGITITGGAASAMQTLPAGQSMFGLRTPLRTNAENTLVVEAADQNGNRVTSAPFKILQISLSQVVTAQVTATRLSVPEIKQLVADGVIDVSDPANFNVSRFDIVLTIAGRQVPVSVPIVQPMDDPMVGTGAPITIGCAQPGQGISANEHAIAIPCGDDGGVPPESPPVQMIPFVIDAPDVPGVPPIPGVILIEGKVKTLKEFYKVSLVLTNVSSLFTLSEVEAMLELPPNALTQIVPASGPIMLDDLPPGTEQTGNFIIRGDQIGTWTITAHFSAKLSGLGIETPVAISGSASTDVEVKGAPPLGVKVTHPSFVQGGVPYDLVVQITDTSPDLPALFTSLSLDVGVDARLLDPLTMMPLVGPVVNDLGDILPGESATRTFRVLPLKSGPISSCTAGVTQNISLDVEFTGGPGPHCAVGFLPSEMADPSGRPTVTVIPTNNTEGVTIDPAIVAIFSAPMLLDSITTGFVGSTFRLTDSAGNDVPTTLSFGTINGGDTVAILHVANVLAPGARYTIAVSPDIFDADGNQLASGETARFTTEGETPPPNDTAPTASIMIPPPVTPGAVPLGQVVPVEVDSADDVAVTRVDLLVDGTFLDTRTPHSPVTFMVDTGALGAGVHTLEARAFDANGNQGSAMATLGVVGDTTPPTAAIDAKPDVQRGRLLAVKVNAADNGTVAAVDVFLDGAGTPAFHGMLAPFQFGLPTGSLAPGPHALHAVATDGAGNTGTADAGFSVVDDTQAPSIAFLSPASGAEVMRGTLVPATAVVTDDVGVQDVAYFLDAEAMPRATDPNGFTLDTTSLAEGPHSITVEAHDLANNPATASVGFSVVTVQPDTTPPAAPDAGHVAVGLPNALHVVTVTGMAGAVESGALVEITDLANLLQVTASAAGDGSFVVQIEAAGGDTLRLVAVDAAGNRSAPTDVPVPVPPSLVTILVAPSPVVLDKDHTSQQLTVTGTFSDSSHVPLTTGLVFTSDDPSTAAVTAGGLVAPGKNGGTTVHVTAGALPPVDIPVTVSFPTVVGVHVSPASVHLLDVGKTQALSVVADLSDNSTAPFTGALAFGAEDATVATVDNAGVVTGVGEGSTTVTVAPAGFASIPVPVQVDKAVLQTIFTTPSSVSLVGVGATQGVAVFGNFSDGSQRPLGGAAFSSNVPGVASVDANGLVTATGDGDGGIHVTVAGAPAIDVPVHVKSIVSIALDPSEFQLIGAGKTRQLGVVATFTDSSTGPVGTAGVGFQSSKPNVATVDANGLVTSTGLGDAVITATRGELTPADSTVHVVARAADGILVSPPSIQFTAAGQTQALSVSFHFNDGTTGPPDAQVVYNSDSPAVASVDASGLVTAHANGTATVHAASGVLDGPVTVMVDIPVSNPPPHIDALDRPRAAEGDPVVVRGSNFAGLPADNAVTVNGVTATVTAARQDELTITVPVGATAGPVQVTAHAQTSNQVTLDVYARHAQTQQVTPALSMPSAPLVLNMPAFPFRTGDRVFLSSAPDVLAPLAFTGTLSAKVDNGSSFPIPLSADATEITSHFTAGSHTLQLRLDDAGGGIGTAAIFLVFGPDGTGAIGGGHSVVAQGQSRPIPVTILGLTDFSDAPLPDGTVVAVSTFGSCTFRDRANNCLDSAGGDIPNGAQSPNVGAGDLRVRNFVVMGGRIDVQFDPSSLQLDVTAGATTTISVLPTDGSGNIQGNHAFVTRAVSLLSFDTAAGSRTQASVIADGNAKLVTITLAGLRDAFGDPVPDGALVTASTFGGCTFRDRDNGCIGSAGGNIPNGSQSPDVGGGDLRARVFQVTNGQVSIQYDPADVTVQVGQTATAVVSVLAARADGHVVGTHAFATIPVLLTPPFAPQGNVSVMPSSTLADDGDNRVTVVVSGIVDQLGNPAPDGTKVAVSTFGSCTFRDTGNGCVDSAGGIIVNGSQSPEVGAGDNRIKVFTVMGGQVDVTYSAAGVSLATPQAATARVTFRPARPDGSGIGGLAFVVADVALGGYDSSTATPNPPSAIADNLPKTVTISVAGIRDVHGNLVPDGATVAASTFGSCTWRDHDNNCVGSAGGVITNGAQSPDVGPGDGRIELFTVMNGQIAVHYDPAGVTLQAGDTATAVVSLLPAQPTTGHVIGGRAFTLVPITLTSAGTDPAHVSGAPTSLLADGAGNSSILTVTNITDGQGRPAPDHTRVAVSTFGGCTFRDLNGSCIDSAGGSVTNGSQSPDVGTGDLRIRVFDVLAQQIQAVYGDAGIRLDTNGGATVRLSVLPANAANDHVIGGRAFAVGTVMLVGYGSADISGAGSVSAGAQATYTVSNITDGAGNPVPDGARVVVATLGGCNHRDAANNCIGSAEGTIVDGTQSPELGNGDFRMKVFTVSSGGFGFTFQAPGGGTSVLQLLGADPAGERNGNHTFALKAVSITP